MSALANCVSTSQMDPKIPHILITGVYGNSHRQLYRELSGQFREGNAIEFFFWKEIELTKSLRVTVSLIDTNHWANVSSTVQSHRPDLVIIMGEHINNTTFTDYLLPILRFSSCPVLCLVSHVDRLLRDFIKYPKSNYDESDPDQVLKSSSSQPIFDPDTMSLFINRMKTIVEELRSYHSVIGHASQQFNHISKGHQKQYRINFQAMTDDVEGTLQIQVEHFPQLRETFMDTDDVIDWIISTIST